MYANNVVPNMPVSFIQHTCLIHKSISLFVFVCSDLISFICPKLSNRIKHLNLILIILILSCCPLHPVYAFLDKDIRLLTMKDGLADNTIPCIYKDEDGFMWFGTDNGLSRYDGKTIQNFKPANTYVSIAAIVRLSDDFLGIVSDGYLYYFNRKQETFFRYILNQILP